MVSYPNKIKCTHLHEKIVKHSKWVKDEGQFYDKTSTFSLFNKTAKEGRKEQKHKKKKEKMSKMISSNENDSDIAQGGCLCCHTYYCSTVKLSEQQIEPFSCACKAKTTAKFLSISMRKLLCPPLA